MESSSTNTTATPISAGSLYSTAEWFAVGGSIGLVVLYFLVHAFVVFRLPLKTTLGINLAERKYVPDSTIIDGKDSRRDFEKTELAFVFSGRSAGGGSRK